MTLIYNLIFHFLLLFTFDILIENNLLSTRISNILGLPCSNAEGHFLDEIKVTFLNYFLDFQQDFQKIYFKVIINATLLFFSLPFLLIYEN